MKRIAFLAVMALAGCSTTDAAPPAQPAPAPAPVTPPPASTPPAPPDSCGAAAVQNLIGRPRTEVPVPLRPELQRVACTTCPVTLDFNPNRLNFFFDAETGLIREIRCG